MGAEPDLGGLPGGALVGAGLEDLRAGRRSVGAMLVSMAAGRLRDRGVLGDGVVSLVEPERMLYAALRAEGGDAYARYNALRRELDSFLAALDHRRRRE
ncbi:MAG: hypothetical protein ACRD01_13140 [Terriglobales bacterium]